MNPSQASMLCRTFQRHLGRDAIGVPDKSTGPVAGGGDQSGKSPYAIALNFEALLLPRRGSISLDRPCPTRFGGKRSSQTVTGRCERRGGGGIYGKGGGDFWNTRQERCGEDDGDRVCDRIAQARRGELRIGGIDAIVNARQVKQKIGVQLQATALAG